MKSTAPKDTDTDKDLEQLELAIEVPTPSTNGVVRQHQPHNSEIDHGDGDVYEESAEKEEKGEGEGQGTVVDWGGPNDPQNPLNWPPIKKRVNFGIIAVITFLSYVFIPAYISKLSALRRMRDQIEVVNWLTDWIGLDGYRPLASSMFAPGVRVRCILISLLHL